MFFKFWYQISSSQWETAVIFGIKRCLINASAYTAVRFSPDVIKYGGYLLLRRKVRQCVNRG